MTAIVEVAAIRSCPAKLQDGTLCRRGPVYRVILAQEGIAESLCVGHHLEAIYSALSATDVGKRAVIAGWDGVRRGRT